VVASAVTTAAARADARGRVAASALPHLLLVRSRLARWRARAVAQRAAGARLLALLGVGDEAPTGALAAAAARAAARRATHARHALAEADAGEDADPFAAIAEGIENEELWAAAGGREGARPRSAVARAPFAPRASLLRLPQPLPMGAADGACGGLAGARVEAGGGASALGGDAACSLTPTSAGPAARPPLSRRAVLLGVLMDEWRREEAEEVG